MTRESSNPVGACGLEPARPGRPGNPRPHAPTELGYVNLAHAGGEPRPARVAARSAAPKGPLGGRPHSGERGQHTLVGVSVSVPRGGDTSSRKSRQQPFQADRPASPFARAPVRRWAFDLLDKLRRISSKRVAACRRKRIASNVQVILKGGRAHFGGLHHCGSVWACPCCSLVIKAKRAAEVRFIVEAHAAKYGANTPYLISATFRHELGDDLRTARQGVAAAWTKMKEGRAWKKFKRDTGLVGDIRGLELTHGANGWHPHIHDVMLFERPPSPSELHWLKERWADCVESALGPEHRPDYEHGLDARECRKADYIAKLGLEIADAVGAKRAKGGNRTPLQIASDFAERGDAADGELWRAYCEGMFRAKQLTWSNGLRKRYGLGKDASDRELADDEVEQDLPILVDFVDGRTWDAVRDIPQAKTFILEAAETGGAAGVARALEVLRNDPRARWHKKQPVRATRPARWQLPELPRGSRHGRFLDGAWRRKHADATAWLREHMGDILDGRVSEVRA